jgi:hypothetical protein
LKTKEIRKLDQILEDPVAFEDLSSLSQDHPATHANVFTRDAAAYFPTCIGITFEYVVLMIGGGQKKSYRSANTHTLLLPFSPLLSLTHLSLSHMDIGS